MAQQSPGGVDRVTFDDGKGSYLPAIPSEELRTKVQRIAGVLAPNVSIVFGTEINHGGDTRAGQWIGPPENAIIIDPQRDGDDQIAFDLAVATAIHECAHAAFTPPAQEQHEITYRNRLIEDDCRSTLGSYVLEDERIETLVVTRWPEWRSDLRKRWDRLLMKFGEQMEEDPLFETFGPQSLQAIAKWDYLNAMVGKKKWYKRPGVRLNGTFSLHWCI